MENLKDYMDYVLQAALRRCDNFADAEDLAGETLLSYITYVKNGNKIEEPKSWLLTVMNRKFYSMLRRKYNRPTVTLLEGIEIADEKDFLKEIIEAEDRELLRKEVAHLSKAYRSIIVKHYFHGMSIKSISEELGIPEGTVKSRLDFGRKQLKKGIENMNYNENSYAPKALYVRNSGMCGMNEEPMSLTENDILAQNLLILAYDKPVTVTELSKMIGVSAAYVEPVIKRLVDGELMKRMGDGKVYTDFIIYEAGDYLEYVKEDENFVSEHIEAYTEPVKRAIEELKMTDFYDVRLERHMMINIADAGLWHMMNRFVKPQIFPDRPNGGKWIAFGTIYPENYTVPENKRGKEEYMMSGQRQAVVDKYLSSKDLKMYNYETSLYNYPKYDGYKFNTFMEAETNILKFLYLIKNNIDPESVDCDIRAVEAIPLLEERGFIEKENGGYKLQIPCLTHEQERKYWKICEAAVDSFCENLSEQFEKYIKSHKKTVPPHLKSVPEQKLYLPYGPGAMMFVYEAIARGVHKRDLGFACPETFIVID